MVGRIEDYALIGDCETAALVCRDGSIDWLCWPRFDSDALFAALLGDEANGRWALAPTGPARSSRRYQEDTLVLETAYETESGSATVIDFMPPRGTASDVVRLVRGDRGSVAFSTELVLRFGYGRIAPWVSRLDSGGLRAVAGPDMVVLRTDVATRGEGMKTVAEFEVAAGETRWFVLTYGPSHLPPPRPIRPHAALEHTQAFWRRWTSRCAVQGRWAEVIRRSLITLKALTYAPSGGVVAAATTSLPEAVGGVRNWDYRFCWIRDATLTLLALMTAGYHDEARAWRDWLLRAVAGRPADMQIMYGITGERRLMEWEPGWLAGYENSRPVRVGNAAHAQIQLDVYGELADALHQARRGGLPAGEQDWHVQRALMDHLEQVWNQPDNGIWEVRGGAQHFTFSKVMAWVAVDRALKDFRTYGQDGDFDRWQAVRQAIKAEVLAHGFNTEKNSFTQVFGGETLDASLLLLAEVGFIEADDPRFVGTVAAVEHELMRDGLVMRYDTLRADDGLPAGEGMFLACSFWLVNAYVLLGRRDDAVALFERLVGLANDLGLLAEEYDTALKRQVGNFPQAFSHIGLINAAFNLTRSARPAEQRAKA